MRMDRAIRRIEAWAGRLPKELERGERANLNTVKRSMLKWTGGKDRSHRRKPVMPINRITGALQGAFETEGPKVAGDGISSAIWNTAPHAKWLEKGTRNADGSQRITPRPLVSTVEQEAAPKVEAKRAQAIERVFR